MRVQQINRVGGRVIIVLSLTALIALLSGYTQPPHLTRSAAAGCHAFRLGARYLFGTLRTGSMAPYRFWYR